MHDPFGLDGAAADPFALPAAATASATAPADADAEARVEPEPDDGPEGGTPDAAPPPRAADARLAGADRALARGWQARAADNLAAVRLSRALEAEGSAPTPGEAALLLRFTGFGATEVANRVFPAPGAAAGPEPAWAAIAEGLRAAVPPAEHAALRRATQYAHYTPEPLGRALWAAALRLGFRGGRVLEPGMGNGLLLALRPDALADGAVRATGVEFCATSARIARLLHPSARVRAEDYTRSRLPGDFDLAIGNPPFSRRLVRPPRSSGMPPMTLHDHFIAASVARLRPGGIALFVTSTGTLDKPDPAARRHIAGMADLLAAVRVPAGSFRATAGTEVTVDLLALRRRAPEEPPGGAPWTLTVPVALSPEGSEEGAPDTWPVNEWFAAHPEAALGRHVLRRGVYGPGLAYALAGDTGPDLEARVTEALLRQLPEGAHDPAPPGWEDAPEPDDLAPVAPEDDSDPSRREGSFLVGPDAAIRQVVGGVAREVPVRRGRGGEGIAPRDAEVVRTLVPVRDALRAVLRAQAADLPWEAEARRLRVAYQSFVRRFGPINRAEVTVRVDGETGERREGHRRPNLAPFADDPDLWLVASIEEFDPDTGLARPGPVFRRRVVAPPAEPAVASAADALAVALSETGAPDLGRVAELLGLEEDAAEAALGDLVFRNPRTGAVETADAHLSGPVRAKLAAAREADAAEPGRWARNVAALEAVQPEDLRPSDISARLGAPWIPARVVERFVAERMGGAEVAVVHNEAFAAWTVHGAALARSAAGTSEWGTPRRHAAALLSDALNGATPQIWDTVVEDGRERRVLNAEATEAAKEKLQKVKDAFVGWVWTDAERADELARVYNGRYNDLRPRAFDGSHLTLPGMSAAVALRPHQRRAIWRIVSAGSTYVAHAVGAGKTMALIAAVMEQRRLGLVSKALVAVPGHCLAQWAREWLALYPEARILVADEENFARDRRRRFLARAATDGWDAVVLTHSAVGLLDVPAAFERGMIEGEMARMEEVAASADEDDRTTRKRIEMRKEALAARLARLRERRDDALTIADLGVDQIVVDEAQAFRKLAFATNKGQLNGVDPDGSARAWDLWVKRRWVEERNPGRALVLASGTPITNTLGEMFTLLRLMDEDGLLRARGLHEFDAWAAAFGDTRVELELGPSGAYRPIERFSEFTNVPELVDLFRTAADVVLPEDLRGYLALPAVAGGQRRLVTAPATEAFRAHQRELAERIRAIEERRGRRPRPGDDILLAVITDGRHAAIDLRLVWPGHPDEPGNKLNLLVREVHRIWRDTAGRRYRGPDGAEMPVPGAVQMVFSDLGTEAVAARRGFSAYRWICDELVRLGVPASEIAFAQDFKGARDKARLQEDARAGRVRVLIGSSETMGTGVNVQNRLVALHHLDVPWLPALVEQREGRIVRQGNGNAEVEILAYATLGSMDAPMWGTLERKARFVAAALSGDRTIRRLEDLDGQAASQFALAKAIASGDARLMRKAGLEAEIARLRRGEAAHLDDALAVRRRIAELRATVLHAEARAAAVARDLARREPTRGEAFRMAVGERLHADRRAAGAALLARLRAAALEGGEDWIAGRIGGFDLRAGSRPHPYGRGGREPRLWLVREGRDVPVPVAESDLTSLGLVARLEHALAGFEEEVEDARRRAADARARLPGYEARAGEAWPLAAELAAKLAELAELEANLARGGPPAGVGDEARGIAA